MSTITGKSNDACQSSSRAEIHIFKREQFKQLFCNNMELNCEKLLY